MQRTNEKLNPEIINYISFLNLNTISTANGAGIVIRDNGGKDFWGKRHSLYTKHTIGVCQYGYKFHQI